MSSVFDRRSGIGASDAVLIAKGDWLPLWENKIGGPEKDLSDVFQVQLGKHTENFHLDWLQRQLGPITGRQTRLMKPATAVRPALYVHADGFTADGVPVEVKHSHGRASLRDQAQYYMAQLQHAMYVADIDTIWFSVICGNADPDCALVERDEDFLVTLLDLEEKFWWHVKHEIAPEILPTGTLARLDGSASDVLVGGYKDDLDMSTHNQWPVLAAEYASLKPRKDRFEAVCKEMKELIPADRKRVYGHGIQVLRTSSGSLQIREHKEKS